MKTIILIDGDNINESYTFEILKEARNFIEENEQFEIHCFGDFVKRKQSWKQSYYEYGVQLHYIPSMDKQRGKPDPNTSDIALTGFAVKKLCENPDLHTCIIVANDKDYAPLAKIIMEEFHKKAIMFYSEPNDKAAVYYSGSVLLKGADVHQQRVVCEEKTDAIEEPDFIKLSNCINEQFIKTPQQVLLSELGPILKDNGIKYKSLGKYLEDMFDKYSILKEQYTLILGDKKDRIERIAK